MKRLMLLVALIAVASSAMAAGLVGTDIPAGPLAASQTWTKAGSPYHLKGQVYVPAGVTLTIEAGTVVASLLDDQGSLAVSRDGDIIINGTAAEPVIMTSLQDVATWTGSVCNDLEPDGDFDTCDALGDPKTGVWRETCNEWGNLTIMGKGYISASHFGGSPVGSNTKCPSATNEKQMEGLTGGSETYYGSGDDNDDSGSINYLSLRYGGKVIGLGNELNGLSLGAIGRNTEISHVEIMNNVDDGIEIWGGTVELDHISIWNIGDDSFDVDQGWRGSAQYGLIVQGYSIDASQGSGVGDNAIEIDGAEDSDAQPMTTTKISNFTVIGQPVHGDGLTTWRDNARVQYADCIFMDGGEKVIRYDENDGDGALGYTGDKGATGDARLYSVDGTLSWVDHWATTLPVWQASGSYDTNGCGTTALDALYAGNAQDPATPLCNIKDSVFYNNADYGESDALGITTTPNSWNNTIEPAGMPIKKVVRGLNQIRGGKVMLNVKHLDPTPAAGVTAGAFSGCDNWLVGWAASDAYGFIDNTSLAAGDADLNCDGITNLGDLGILGGQWLN